MAPMLQASAAPSGPRRFRAPPASTLQILNPRREPVYTREGTLRTTAGTALQISGGTAAGGFVLYFDPTGTYNNNGPALAAQAMPDWSALSQCFDQYRVNHIKIRMTCREIAGAAGVTVDTNPLVMSYRYNEDSSNTAPTAATISELVGTNKKIFTTADPVAEYTVYPVEYLLGYNTGILPGTSAFIRRKADWTDVQSPTRLYGFQIVTEVALSAVEQVDFEITYNVSFRMQK